MGGDYSRRTFDHKNDFNNLFIMQGRVQLDADWNELAELIERRFRTETVDIIGRCVVPKETPSGFKITTDGSKLNIGLGRIYVHGLLAENRGSDPSQFGFDPVLSEVHGNYVEGSPGYTPLDYKEQLYLKSPPDLPGAGGPHLVYVDVWQREVTYLEKPEMVEKAVGIDTSTRMQTVWQVKVLPDVGSTVTCSTPLDQVDKWVELTKPSAGRLSVGTAPIDIAKEPCQIPPASAYRGVENRLYRVEIHDDGSQPGRPASFKWSNCNASIATAVTQILAWDKFVVDSVGRDPVLRFSDGDWVEIIDDWLEFAQQPGIMRRIKLVDDATRTITFTAQLSASEASMFPISTDPEKPYQTLPERHTRIRRWDQKGKILDKDGHVYFDLDSPGRVGITPVLPARVTPMPIPRVVPTSLPGVILAPPPGVIPVPPPATSLILEDGVKITFSKDPSDGRFHVGDYWIFAARTADGTVEEIDNAPPMGIYHHYGRLAMVTFNTPATDCRVLWPPDTAEGCECTICVTADSHNKGTQTIQWALDQVKTTGGTVCLGVGTYQLGPTPIQIVGAQSVHMKGQGWKTVLKYDRQGTAITIDRCHGLTLEDLVLMTRPPTNDPSPAVSLHNSSLVTLERSSFLRLGNVDSVAATISLSGVLLGTRIRENLIVGAAGIANIISSTRMAPAILRVASRPAPPPLPVPVPALAPVFTAGLHIQDNALYCRSRGLSLEGVAVHTSVSMVSGNVIHDCPQGGVVAKGFMAPGSVFNITRNELHTNGRGIVLGTDDANVTDNSIAPTQPGQGGDGIVLENGFDQGGIDRCQILNNRIVGVNGDGISLTTYVRSAMIKNNVIDGVAGDGISATDSSRAGLLSIENNHLLNIAPSANDPKTPIVGIRVVNAERAEVTANSITRLGASASQAPKRVAVELVSPTSARITGNELSEIGPAGEALAFSAGIECSGTFERLDIVDNAVRRSLTTPQSPSFAGGWLAVRIPGPTAPAATSGTTDGGTSQPEYDYTLSSRDTASTAATTYRLTGTHYFVGSNVYTFSDGGLVYRPREKEIVSVQGNLLEAYGGSVLISVDVTGAFIFCNNKCLLSSDKRPLASVTASSMIASSNYLHLYLHDGPADSPTVYAFVPENKVTALGNIMSGTIMVGGAALKPPWAGLNLLGG